MVRKRKKRYAMDKTIESVINNLDSGDDDL